MKLKALGANRLWMIDRRYAHPRIVKRIRADLEPSGLKLEFVTPKDHQDFLVEISKLEYMVDTRPYSAGLTAREALSLGVQIISEPGPLLFSSRHGLAANAQQTKLLRQFSSSTDEARQNRVAQQLAQRIRKTIQAEGRAN